LIKNILFKNKQILIISSYNLYIKNIFIYLKKVLKETIVKFDHSTSRKKKQLLFHLIRFGKVQVIIGSKDALFLPFKNLGLIILDKTHELSYFKRGNVKFTVKYLSIVKANIEKIPIIFNYNFLSIGCYLNYKKKKYNFIRVNKRNKIEEKDINVFEKTSKSNNNYLSNNTISSIQSCLLKKKQVILLFCSNKLYYEYQNTGMEKNNIKKINNKFKKVIDTINDKFKHVKISFIDLKVLKKQSIIKDILINMERKNIDILCCTTDVRNYTFNNVGLISLIDMDDLFNKCNNYNNLRSLRLKPELVRRKQVLSKHCYAVLRLALENSVCANFSTAHQRGGEGRTE